MAAYHDLRIPQELWAAIETGAQAPPEEGFPQEERDQRLIDFAHMAQQLLACEAPPNLEEELEETRAELRTALLERDAARTGLAAAQQQARDLTAQLNQVLAIAAAQIRDHPEGGTQSGGFPDAPTFDGTKPEELRTWILQLRNKLAAQPTRYPTEQARLRYAFNRLSGAALNQLRSYADEDTGDITLASLNDLLTILRQAYDDPDRSRTAAREIRRLRQRNLPFSTYLADFRRLMGDLNWDEVAQKDQLYEGLSEEMKDALLHRAASDDTLAAFVNLCKDVDNRIRARAEERKPSSSRPTVTTTNHRSNPRPHAPSSSTATAPATTGNHPTNSNSGNYGPAPMELSAARREAERQRIREERMAKGQCTYCGSDQHFRLDCPRRLAAEARRVRAAEASLVATATPTAQPSENLTPTSDAQPSEN
jgi:hypothetical protein